ncbi:MAG: ubiquitin-specific protease doa4 [Bathelium mastoideum]|nr:MAG: ubiquitin-specific protease doa4 [Bathelium mastoideum]
MPDGPMYENGQSPKRAGQRTSVGSVSDIPSGRSTPSKARPLVQPKPEGMHGRNLHYGNGEVVDQVRSVPADALGERFARLRTSGISADTIPLSLRPGTSSSQRLIVPESPVTMPSPSSWESAGSYGSQGNVPSPSKRPFGPRGMPPAGVVPPHPPKLPLDTHLANAMPKAPSPTYSPARNMPTPASINPPRTTARSMVSTGRRSNSVAYSTEIRQPSIDEGSVSSYFPPSGNGVITGRPGRGNSLNLSSETQIPAIKLHDFLRMYAVLLIDVRPREDFDQGHIWSQSIMCIEPTGLRPNMSAEELQDSLVISPDAEQEMFDRRDQYDLVVYYDQRTITDEYLSNNMVKTETEIALRSLHDALFEFNQEKPLRRPPILLSGGVESWADLVGVQALKASDTAGFVRSQKSEKKARRLGRVPVPRESSVVIRKRRLRDYNPLDEEEERKWVEKARIESVSVEPPPQSEDDEEQPENATPIVRSYEDYLRRFPEVSALEQQSMVTPLPPERSPPTIPSYHPPPMPQVPTRPAPAAPRVSYSGVHDRSVSSNAPVSRTTHLPSYIPPQNLPQNLRLPRTGLVNFGVTCYMNATLQCLSATAPLSLFFRDDAFRGFVQKENWKGSRGLMPEFFAIVIRSLWKGDVSAIRPSSFRGFCSRLNQEWGIDRQQDAKEFFDFLIDVLHEDLNTNWSRTPLRSLTTEEEAVRERLPKFSVSKTEWSRYLHREQSYLTNLFGGQHASRLRCMTCNFTSTTYEAFYSISVEIPRSGTGDIRDCLRHYCAEERLSGDEVWKCPQCNKEREATKQITITRAPQFLVVHFKRFSASRTESARKVRTPVDFPLQGLNLEPYMLAPPSQEDAEYIARKYGPEQLKPDIAMSPPQIYDAYAVMRHIGTTMTSGHYVALIKDQARQCWRQFNDAKVDDFEPSRLREGAKLQNEQAYIVFYQRAPGRP